MSLRRKLAGAVVALLLSSAAQAAVIVEYNTMGRASTTPPDTAPATTTATGVTAADLGHGAGIGTTGLGNGYSQNNWGVDNGGTWVGNSSYADALTNNDYFEWAFTVDSSHTVSLSTLDLAMRRSAVASPNRFEVYASLDGFATAGTSVANWGYFGRNSGTAPGTVAPYQWMTTDTAGQTAGNPISTQTLSDDGLLQNIGPDQTVTFRLYGWYEGTGTSAGSNTVALGRAVDGVTSGGPSLGGTVTAVPEPASLGLALAGAVIAFRRPRRP